MAAEGTGATSALTLPAPDWDRPWFQPWRMLGASVVRNVQAGASVHAALNDAGPGLPAPVTFMPQSALTGTQAYEAFVAVSGSVPTRDNLHDLFNGLCWRRFPRTKRQLNRWQAQAIARQGVGSVRGPLRDAITVLDENGACLQAPPELLGALRARQWQRLFVDLRAQWSRARLQLFGHALLEKLVSPYPAITAHVLTLPLRDGQAPLALDDNAAWDERLLSLLDEQSLASKPFVPLPVLGVPGWWPDNEAPAFYADTRVFRPAPAVRMARVDAA